MPQARVLSLHTGHIGLGNNPVFIRQKPVVDLPSVADPKVALPDFDSFPQWLEGLSAAVSECPVEYSPFEVVYRCPQPSLVFFDPTKVCSSSTSPTSGYSGSSGLSSEA